MASNKLTAVFVRSAPPGRHGDGGGLYLDKTEDGGKWLYRYTNAGRRRDMGLGPLATVSLAQARKDRDRWAAVLAAGRDPITERDAERAAQAAEAALGHVIGGAVRRAYARSDMLDARAALMQRWADYVTGEAAQVVPLRSGK